MHITMKKRSAVQAMAELAKLHGSGPTNVADLSDSIGFSISYLEQLFTHLRNARLVRGVRGPGGGYELARDPKNITVAEVVDCIDRHMEPERIPSLAPLEKEHRALLQRFTLDRLVS